MVVLYKLPSGRGNQVEDDDDEDKEEEENLGFLTGQREDRMKRLFEVARSLTVCDCDAIGQLVNGCWSTGSPAQASEALAGLVEHPLVLPSTH